MYIDFPSECQPEICFSFLQIFDSIAVVVAINCFELFRHFSFLFQNLWGQPALKASFQVDGLGGDELVHAEEMCQRRIVPVDQGVYFLHAKTSQMRHEFIDQLRADSPMPAIGVNTDGIQGCLFMEDAEFSHIEFPHDKTHHRSVFILRHKRRGQIFLGLIKPFKLHLIVLRPGNFQYFPVNPDHSVKILSLPESDFNGARVHDVSFLFGATS
jgi:hypothetical protein